MNVRIEDAGADADADLGRAAPSSLGMRNVRVARQMLAERGIAVLAEDTGGTRGRRVMFRTDSGDVVVRRF